MQAQKNSFSTQALLTLLVGNALILTVAVLVPESLGIVIGAGVVITVAMWFVVRSTGGRAIEQAAAEPVKATTPKAEAPDEPPRMEKPDQPSEAPALQLLSIFQREGRLIDFLQEDIQPYDDAQIGAAVRQVHEGCRRALHEHVELAPVMDQPEGSTVKVEPGFDANEVRLTGNVAGDPPFTGALRHRGWRVIDIELPELMQTQKRVVAAAEVEV